MTVKSIMTANVVTLKPADTVADGLVLMCREGIHNIPVVDDNECFVGLFSLRRITSELLPKAARLGPKVLDFELNFMPDEPDELVRRLQKIGRQPVSELLEKRKKLRFCSPDTPIPEMLKLLSENPTSLPVLVVKGKEQKLQGMVSNWDVLTKLAVTLVTGKPQDEACRGGGTRVHPPEAQA